MTAAGILRGLFLDSTAKQTPEYSNGMLDYSSTSCQPNGHSCQTAAASSSNTEYDKLHTVLEGLVSRQRPLFLTGHSLGGATAALFAMGLAARSSIRTAIYSAYSTAVCPAYSTAVYSAYSIFVYFLLAP